MSNDFINRQAAIKVCDLWQHEYDESASRIDDIIHWIAEDIEKMPSTQPEIIACGDCKHWICHDRRCGYWNHGVKPLDWCCHAERRTDGEI